MDDYTEPQQMLAAYGEASSVLSPLLAGLSLLALVRGALRSGVLAQARQPCTPSDIACRLGTDEVRVTALCEALDAHGVFVRERDCYHLEERWATLDTLGLPFSLEASIDSAFAQMEVLEHATPGTDSFWTLSPESRLALAKGITMDPFSPYSPLLVRQLIQESSLDLHILLTAGGRYLELGCGVSGGLLSLLQAYPNVSAVGVELAPDLLVEARQRAVLLGVDRRACFIQGDARDYNEHAAFDLAFWSQFFFPAPSRTATLQVILRALKPGGFLMAPLLEEPSAAREDLHTEQGRQFALNRLLYGQWGVPAVGARELQHEVVDAGFRNAREVHIPPNRVVLARRL